MNNTEIDILIAARNRLTNRRDEQIDFAAVDKIDAPLSTCEPGRRNDVDLLLGRTCATLPQPTQYDLIDRLEYSMTHDRWTCKFCGAVNQSWELHCACETLSTPPVYTWDCHFCGIAQPAWAGDCLTCEQHAADDAREDKHEAMEDWRHCRIAE